MLQYRAQERNNVFFSFCLRIVEKAFEGAVEIGTPYIYRRTRKHARSLVLSQNRVKKK